jgi:hypothetical protein
VSSSQLTQDPDRVRSFGGYNTAALAAVRLEREEKQAEKAAAIAEIAAAIADASMIHGIAVESMKALRFSLTNSGGYRKILKDRCKLTAVGAGARSLFFAVALITRCNPIFI